MSTSRLYQDTPGASKNNAFCWKSWDRETSEEKPRGAAVLAIQGGSKAERLRRALQHGPKSAYQLARECCLDPRDSVQRLLAYDVAMGHVRYVDGCFELTAKALA